MQDDNKYQDRDERPPVPGRLIARDSSRKRETRLFPSTRLKNDVRQKQVRIPFLRVSLFFGNLYSTEEDVPATLAVLPVGRHRHRQR